MDSSTVKIRFMSRFAQQLIKHLVTRTYCTRSMLQLVERNGNSKLTPFTMYMLALEVILSRFKQSIVCGVILYTVSKVRAAWSPLAFVKGRKRRMREHPFPLLYSSVRKVLCRLRHSPSGERETVRLQVP